MARRDDPRIVGGLGDVRAVPLDEPFLEGVDQLVAQWSRNQDVVGGDARLAVVEVLAAGIVVALREYERARGHEKNEACTRECD